MATKHGSLFRGRIGDKVYYVVDGKQRVRSVADHVANPRTDEQQSHRDGFADIVRLSSRMADAHTLGLHYIARRKRTRPYLYFRSINKDCFTPNGQIDYPRIILSYGSVARVDITSVKTQTIKRSDTQAITITFDPCLNCGNADPDDEFYLYAYCPPLGIGTLFRPVLRKSGTITVTLPKEWLLNIHLYAFLRFPGPMSSTPEDDKPSAKNRRGHTSSTIYIPLP